MTRHSIFIDVGSHRGETLQEVTKPLWKFNVIFGFEPQKSLATSLQKEFSIHKNVVILPVGLSDHSGTSLLYGSGMGASIFSGKRDIDARTTQFIELMSAAYFFNKNINNYDCVIMKLNCEGAEAQILTDLTSNNELDKITNVMIDFDLRKIRGLQQQPSKTINMLKSAKFTRYFLAEDVMVGKTHGERIHNWLAHVPTLDDFCTCPAQVKGNIKTPNLKRRVRRFFRYP